MANASYISLLVLLSAMYIVAVQQNKSNITQGSSLTPTRTSSWLSPSGLFAFGFYPQGHNSFRVGIFIAGLPMNKTVVWTANRDDPPISDDVTLRLTEGKLILQRQSQNTFTDVLALNQSISYAYMLDSGNFVLYDFNRKIIWQSFDNPTDTILPGQSLGPNQELVSSVSPSDYSTGNFQVNMQSDSNLVQYPAQLTISSLNSYWSTGTYGMGGVDVKLTLEPDGHLYLLTDSFYVLKNLTKGFPEKQRLYLTRMDFDGILRLYSFDLDRKGSSSSVVWESLTDRCIPKGICGQNAYCSVTDDDYVVDCVCPPGYNYSSPDKRNAGCDRNFDAPSCNNNNNEQPIQYNLTRLNNTRWEDEPETIKKTKDHEDCKKACLENCMCDAAFFKDGQCSMLSLPLKYGRVVNDSSIAYIKWALPTPEKAINSSKGGRSLLRVLTAGIGAGLIVIVVVLLSSYWGVRRHRQRLYMKQKENYFKLNGGIMLQQLLHKSEDITEKAKIYTEEELKKATDNFSESNVIGQGGSGTVYKGVLDDTGVAIKKSKVVDRSQIDQFVNEVIILSQIRHPNVVKLLGCCLETPVPLLVYEFVTNKILFDHIHDEDCASSIPWDMRLRIATETASALVHMHSAPVHIIHRDVKSANILLDDEYTAKVSDFGVSRLFSPEITHLATLVQGTFGYIDPEYFHSGILTQKSDVYSFGVVLVELLTGAKVVSFEREEKDRNLVMYFLSAMESDRLHNILEPRVKEEGHTEQLRGVAMLAERCLRIEGHRRPTMKEVGEELEFLILKNIDRANMKICM